MSTEFNRVPRQWPGQKQRDYLSALLTCIGSLDPDQFLEIRTETNTGMKQAFIPANLLREAQTAILRSAKRTNVYIGAAPRAKQSGKREAIERVPMLWMDLDNDSPESAEVFEAFEPAPTFIIASGTGDHRHAWWLLDKPVSPYVAELANRRLAHAVGADPRCADAARILRPPGTFNHKHNPPTRVELVEYAPAAVYSVFDVVGGLPDPPDQPKPANRAPRTRTHADRLLDISPAEYVPALTGEEPNARRKVVCPFHADSDASLHVYDDPDKGWKCYGCGLGGTIYDFAARLWGLETRGAAFRELQRKLRVTFPDDTN